MLQDAIDSIGEGFVIFDAEERLVTCNEGYRRRTSAVAEGLVPGLGFADLLRRGLAAGDFGDVGDQPEAWIDAWVQRMREVPASREADGGWHMAAGDQRRMRNGGIARLRMDITTLKQAQARCATARPASNGPRKSPRSAVGSWTLSGE